MKTIKPLSRVLQWLQAKCEHDPRWVRVDILEGDSPNRAVSWCYRCGAYQILSQKGIGEWRTPKAAWAEFNTLLP